MSQVDWLLVDLNSYFASCEQQQRPELRGKPIAVVAMITDSTSVLAASYEAKKFGIKTNTSVKEAKRICPGIIFVKTSHRLYLDFHDKIIDAVEEIIPIHSVLSVDEMSCQLMGTQRELTNAITLAKKLKLHICQKVGSCLTSSVGLGPNTLIAKMASDMQKPDGLVWIPKEEISTKLGPLSVRDIPGVGEKTEQRLNRLGYRKVSDLLKISDAQARSVWGSIVGPKTLGAIRGESYVYAKGATKSISHEHVLPPQLRNLDDAFQIAQKLLNKAAVRLRKNSYVCSNLNISIRFLNGEKFEVSRKFDSASDTGFFMHELTKIWQTISKGKPLKVSVVLSGLSLDKDRQLTFFDDSKLRREKAFAVADKINEKMGSQTIFIADLKHTKAHAVGGIAFSRVPDKEEFEG